MDFRAFALPSGGELKKKFKDVRRRTAQKMAEVLGVTEAVPGNSQVSKSYREYVWLGSYLDKLRNSVVTTNKAMHAMIQTTFQLATQLQAELTPEEDEEGLPPQLKRIYAMDPDEPHEMFNRTDVIVGCAGDFFDAQAYINGEPLGEYFDSLRKNILEPIEKELEQNESLTALMLEECEEARLDYAAYQRQAATSEKAKAKAEDARVALEEEEAQLHSHLVTRIRARCRLMTSTMALLVQLQSSFFGTVSSTYDTLASENLPLLQLCQLEAKVVDVKALKQKRKEMKKLKKQKKLQQRQEEEEEEAEEESSSEEQKVQAQAAPAADVDFFGDSSAAPAQLVDFGAAPSTAAAPLDDIFGAPLVAESSTSMGGLGGLAGLDFNAKPTPKPAATPVQTSSSGGGLDDIFGTSAAATASSSTSAKSASSHQSANWAAHASAQKTSFNPFAGQQQQQQQQQFVAPKHYQNMKSSKPKAPKKPDPTDNPLRRKLRQEREQREREASAARVQELRDEEAAAAALLEQKKAVDGDVMARVNAWSGAGGKKTNLRSLLSTMEQVLWEGSGWKPVPLSELMNPKKVRRSWLRAAAIVHPDKVQGESVERQVLAERIFNVLRDSFDVFKKELGQ